VFRKEMQVQMSLLIQRSLPASMADGVDGGKPPGKWPSRDELLRQAREVEQDAHTKSGLTPSDSEQLGSLLSPYFKKRTAAVLAGKKLSELREKAETGPLSETDEATRKKLTDQVEQFRTVREEYERKWGKNVLAIVDKHESELLGLMAPGMVMVFPK
jgi:hypothetical protein